MVVSGNFIRGIDADRLAMILGQYIRERQPSWLDSWLNRLLQTNISNLAGVPSIIYGILGLAVFVRLMNLGSTVLSAGVGPSVFYGLFVEMGTRRMGARPYMRPAAEAVLPKFAAAVKALMGKL